MKLRAHHLLCLFGFRGLGYSKDFVKNFAKVLKQIKDKPQLLLEIIDRPDCICARCPHQKNNGCQKNGLNSERQVRDRDNLIIKRLGIRKGYRAYAGDIFNFISRNIFPQDLTEICIGCEWLKYGYCVEGLRQKRFLG